MNADRAVSLLIVAMSELVSGLNEQELTTQKLDTAAKILASIEKSARHLRRRVESELAARGVRRLRSVA